MSLRELAALDGLAILGADCQSATLTAPGTGGAVYSCKAWVIRSGVSLDANGLPIAQDTTSVTLSLGELASLGLTNPDTLKSRGWTLSVTDVTGATISGEFNLPLLDRTLGRVTGTIKRSA